MYTVHSLFTSSVYVSVRVVTHRTFTIVIMTLRSGRAGACSTCCTHPPKHSQALTDDGTIFPRCRLVLDTAEK